MATQPVLANAGSDGSDAEFYEILVEMGLLDADANSQITDAIRAAVLRLRGKHGLDLRFNEHRQHKEDRDAHGQASVSAVADALAASITDDQGSSVCVEAALADALGSKSTSSSSKASASKAGIADNQTPGANHEAGGTASNAASSKSKARGIAVSSDDEDINNPFKKKKLSGGVLSSRPRWRADVIMDGPALSDMMAASSARDETSVSLYRPPVLPDLTSEQFMYIKCMVLGNNFDIDIAPFHDQVRHLEHLDTYIRKIGQSSKVLSISKEDAVAYVDAVLVKLKGDGNDGDDGDAHYGFPGIGQAENDDEALGYKQAFPNEFAILVNVSRISK